MITEFLLQLSGAIVGWLGSLFPQWDPPQWLIDAGGEVNALMTMFASLGVWFNWPVIGACVGIAVAAWAAVAGIKLLRTAVSHIPFFGGSGA